MKQRKKKLGRLMTVALTAMMLFTAMGLFTFAQDYGDSKFEITPYIGYQFGGQLHAVGTGDYKLDDSLNYGIALDLTIRPGLQLELLYHRQDTEIRLITPIFDTSVEYFHIGGLYQLRWDRVSTFVLATLGTTHFNPDPAGLESEWRFSWSLGVGAKVFMSERIGFRIQGRLLSTWLSGTQDIYFGGPGGVYIRSGYTMYQVALSAGLIIAF